jgi:hypothetical protein
MFPLLATALLLGAHLKMLLPGHHHWPRVRTIRESSYFQAADWIRAHGRPGQSVLVGEVGVLAWALPEYKVIDSAGINSRPVYRARLADAERIRAQGLRLKEPDIGTADWVRQILSQMRPDYLVSIEVILHLSDLRADPQFQNRYTLVRTIENYPSPPVLIYQRKY